MDVTVALVIGAVPGTWLGAQLSSRAPCGVIRRAPAFVLLDSALKLLNVPDIATGLLLFGALLVAPLVWMLLRRRQSFPALPWREREKQPATL